jgi:beta-aspartyl-peptidase (threonine type)
MGQDRTWSLAVHGGAHQIEREQEEAHRNGCLAALASGEAILRRGGPAIQAVEAAIRVLEDDPTFNAGNGAARNAEGVVELDAAIMDGRDLALGGVTALRGARNPIAVARLLLREKPVLLAADGARRFAESRGIAFTDHPIRPADAAGRSNTVGCVARDMSGHLAAGTSTGGLEGCAPGRVGDSPLAGCGLYADDQVGAVVFSGDGEEIVRTMLAARVIHALDIFPPQRAIEAAIARVARLGAEAGGLVLDSMGRFGWAHNSPHFSVSFKDDGMAEARIMLRRTAEATPHA